MRRYRTEILIPADRTVVLHLPPHLPEGRAAVIVLVEDDPAHPADEPLDDLHHHDQLDIEWWDEFDDGENDDGDNGNDNGNDNHDE